MRQVEKWRWKIRWAGRTTASHYATEDEIRVEHPEAVRVEDSRIVEELPETPQEIAAAMQPRGRR